MSEKLRNGALAGLVALVLVYVVPVFAAGIPVPATRAGKQVSSIAANNLKPSQCSEITVTAKKTGSGTISGTSAAELITGSGGVDTVSAAGGNDCVLGGGGNDSLNGGSGTDVCIGGPGTDTFSNCETQIQ